MSHNVRNFKTIYLKSAAESAYEGARYVKKDDCGDSSEHCPAQMSLVMM